MEKLENKLEDSADNFLERLLENYPLASRRVQIELKNLKRKKVTKRKAVKVAIIVNTRLQTTKGRMLL